MFTLFLESVPMKLIAIVVEELVPLGDVLPRVDANPMVPVDHENLRVAVWFVRMICKPEFISNPVNRLLQ